MLNVLKFFQIVDRGTHLSLSNLSVIAVLTKILASDAVSQADLLALCAVLANYAIKRVIVYLEDRTPKPSSVDVDGLANSIATLTKDLEDAKTKIQGLTMKAAITGAQKAKF